MKAIVVSEFGGPEVLRVKECNDPTPGADQVVVDVKAAGVNPVDTYRRAGGQGYQGELPFTPGIDGAGTVSAVGSDVQGIGVGDRVYITGSISGTYAEHCLCAAGQVHPLPEHDADGNPISFETGACLWVNYGTAYRALFQRGEAKLGDWVLVHGATGGVGVAAIQWAKAKGLHVVGSAGSEDGIKMLQDLGVDLAVNHHDSSRVDAIKEATDGGPAVIVEMLANVNLETDMGLVGKNGRIVIVGSRGSVEVTPRRLMGKEADVRGLILFGAVGEELETIHREMQTALSQGVIRPVIQQTLPLAEAPEAHRAVIEDKSHGKIVLVP
jgi:NADPH2:quinone reductase